MKYDSYSLIPNYITMYINLQKKGKDCTLLVSNGNINMPYKVHRKNSKIKPTLVI
jgi:hypothetical protein